MTDRECSCSTNEFMKVLHSKWNYVCLLTDTIDTFEMRMAAARTRPIELINKRGSGGTACKLTSNYFELVRQTNCSCTGSTLTRPSN